MIDLGSIFVSTSMLHGKAGTLPKLCCGRDSFDMAKYPRVYIDVFQIRAGRELMEVDMHLHPKKEANYNYSATFLA